MNKIFFSAFFIYIVTLVTSLIGQEYPILKSSLPNESLVKQICLSDLRNHSGVCADCDTITKVFELNQKAGFISSKLQKNAQKQTTSLLYFSAKMLRRKRLQDTLNDLENKCNALSQEYSESISRLLSLIDLSNHNINFDDFLAYENRRIQQGLINAATNVSVKDEVEMPV